MKLSLLVDPRHVILGRDFPSVEAAAEAAIHAMAGSYPQSVRPGAAVETLKKREALGGTLLPTGVAIPHARLEGFDDIIIGAVVPKNPIPTAEGIPVGLVWVSLFSLSRNSLYLNALRAFASLDPGKELGAELCAAHTPHRFVEILASGGFDVKKDLHVEDIMSREVVSVPPEASLRQAIDLMYERKLRYLPVVDASGKVAGELGVLDIIAAGLPDYALRLENLAFLDELEPMSELLANEGSIPVTKVMKPAVGSFAPGDSIIEAAMRMTKSRKRHFPVVDGGKIVGVLSSMDILTKVLRA